MQDDSVPAFDGLSRSKLESDLNSEYGSLESGYNNAKTKRIDFYQRYRFELYGNEREGSSSYVDSTIFNAIEWMVPTFVQPFIETQNLVHLDPEGSDAASLIASRAHKELLQYQLRKKTDFYTFLYDMAKTFFIDGESYAKHVWIKKDKKNGEPVSRNSVVHVPSSAIRYDWNVKDMCDSYVVTEDKDITRSEVVLMRGKKGVIGDCLEKVLEGHGRNERDSELSEEQKEHPNHAGENESFRTEGNKLYRRREHWTEYDVDGSGVVTPILAVFINDVLVQVVRNPYPYNKHPYQKAECVRDPEGGLGVGFAELLAPIQAFKTGIFRMFSDNLNAQNNGMFEVDTNFVDDVGLMILQRAPAGARTPIPSRKIGSIQPLQPAPIAGHSMQVMEMLNVESENRTGFTRYSQGLDSSSLNQTATGISAIIQRSEMRMWELAARFAESFLKPLVRKCIMMNQTGLTEMELKTHFSVDETTIGDMVIAAQPQGTWLKLNKDDLGGYFTISIDLETPTSKEKKSADLAQWAQYFGPLLPPEIVQGVAAISANQVGLKDLENLMRGISNGRYYGQRGPIYDAFGDGAGQNGEGAGAGPVGPVAPEQLGL